MRLKSVRSVRWSPSQYTTMTHASILFNTMVYPIRRWASFVTKASARLHLAKPPARMQPQTNMVLSRLAATIVLLHGICYGLAIDISSAADIRLCSNTPPAQFCVKEVDIGLAADIGTLTRLPKIVGSESWAKEVCLSARVWGAEEAARVGFVGRVIEGGKERGLEEVGILCFHFFLSHTTEDDCFMHDGGRATISASASSYTPLTILFKQGARPGIPHRIQVTRSSPRHKAPHELQQGSRNCRRYVTLLPAFPFCDRLDLSCPGSMPLANPG